MSRTHAIANMKHLFSCHPLRAQFFSLLVLPHGGHLGLAVPQAAFQDSQSDLRPPVRVAMPSSQL
jgi:hypothetical protein